MLIKRFEQIHKEKEAESDLDLASRAYYTAWRTGSWLSEDGKVEAVGTAASEIVPILVRDRNWNHANAEYKREANFMSADFEAK